MKKFLSKIFSVRVLIVLFLAIEILAFFFLYFLISDYIAEIKAYLTILGIITAFFVFHSKMNSSYKIAWLLVLVIVPVFGTVCYVLFANKKFTKHETRKMRPTIKALERANSSKGSNNALNKIDTSVDYNAFEFGSYLNKYSNNGIYSDTKVTYFPWGEDAWKVMLEKLESAKHYIFMEYFIIQPGLMWDSMLDILKRKASEGVEVRLLYDDLGCLSTLHSRYYKEMRKYGIKCHPVNPIRPLLDIRMNNRDHRKIMVIDGHTGFTGGINLADEYINHIERFGKWKDNAIMLEGNGVFGLTSLFLSTWSMITKTTVEDFSPYYPTVYKSETKPFKNDGYVAPYGSLPFVYETVGRDVYINLLGKANHYVYITTPYLILDEELENAICRCAKRGVKVKLLTPHIPDKNLVFQITRSYYRNLVEAGVEIYEYTPGFVHAKTFLVDGEMATVGTVNLDYRSLYLHMENGCFMYKCECIKDIEKDMVETFAQSGQITLDMVRHSPASKRLLRFILKMFSTAL